MKTLDLIQYKIANLDTGPMFEVGFFFNVLHRMEHLVNSIEYITIQGNGVKHFKMHNNINLACFHMVGHLRVSYTTS